MYNLCVRRGGWKITVVMPMSDAPVAATVDPSDHSQPAPCQHYPPHCVVVKTAHPKVLMGNQQGAFSAADRQEMASLALRDIMKGIALFRGGSDNLHGRVLDLYTTASRHPSFSGFVWTSEELKNGKASAECSQERAGALASRNGKAFI